MEEIIDEQKLIDLMLSLNEDSVSKLILKTEWFTPVEKEQLRDFLAYLILKAKIKDNKNIKLYEK